MKKVLLLFVGISLISCAAYTPVNVTPEGQEKVFEIEGSKNDLYVRANNWMVESFGSAESVIQFTDKESGIVTGKYLVGSVYPSSNHNGLKDVFAIVRLQLKDDAAKITVTPESYQYIDAFGVEESHKLSPEKVETQISEIMDSFGEYMASSNSDW